MATGTVMHSGKLPLRTWFQAVHLLTSHSNGINADQAQAQLGIGLNKIAWLLITKLSRPVVDPDRTLLRNISGGDETEFPRRFSHNRFPGYGMSDIGKMQVVGAVELDDQMRPR